MTNYRTKKIRHYRRRSYRKASKHQGKLTRIFHLCLKCTLLGLGIVSISFASIMLYKKISQSPYFQAKKILVEGCVRYTPAQILYLACIQPRVNLLSLDLKQSCQSVENSPWIERAKIKRILPDQLEISIIEREAVALINLSQLYLVDKKGTIFKKAEKEDGFVLPVLTGVTWKNLMNNQQLYTLLITQALTLMDLFEKEGIPLATISEINLDATFGLTVFTTLHATQIQMGFPPFQEKCKHLYAILHDLEQKNLLPQTIDLNYSNKAFVKGTPRSETIKPIKKGGENQWGKMEI